REEAGVREIEDAALAVVELAEEEAQAHDEERDVARARVEGPARLQDLGDLADAFLRALQMLEHVEHEHAVVPVSAERAIEVSVEIELDRLGVPGSRGSLDVGGRHVRDLLRQLRAED